MTRMKVLSEQIVRYFTSWLEESKTRLSRRTGLPSTASASASIRGFFNCDILVQVRVVLSGISTSLHPRNAIAAAYFVVFLAL